MADATGLGKRIAHHRKHLGLSQAELADLVGRSESWMSQVERGVRSIDRLSVLQKVADVLSVSVAELRGSDEEDESPPAVERPEGFEELRLVLTGHPAIGVVLTRPDDTITEDDLERLRHQHAPVWDLVHDTRYGELAPILGELIPELERAVRLTVNEDVRRAVRSCWSTPTKPPPHYSPNCPKTTPHGSQPTGPAWLPNCWTRRST